MMETISVVIQLAKDQYDHYTNIISLIRLLFVTVSYTYSGVRLY